MSKDIRSERCRLYLVSPPAIDAKAFAEEFSAALAGGDVASLQLRLKEARKSDIVNAAEILLPICHANDVALIINDSPEIAKLVGADGVHLGQSDMSIEEARALLGPDAVIGATCHGSRDLAFVAGDQGADYIAFGAFFPTSTKVVTHSAEPEILEWWSDIAELPCVAIGGINADNCAGLAHAGAHFVAVSSFVWDHGHGPGAAVTAINAALDVS